MASTVETIETPSGCTAAVSQKDDVYGHIKEIALNPQPTADPLDPLNFSKAQKWAALGIVMWMYVVPTIRL